MFKSKENRDFNLCRQHVTYSRWMDERFAIVRPFLTVFQLYQDDVWVIMKGYVQWNLVFGWKDYRIELGSNPGPLDQ